MVSHLLHFVLRVLLLSGRLATHRQKSGWSISLRPQSRRLLSPIRLFDALSVYSRSAFFPLHFTLEAALYLPSFFQALPPRQFALAMTAPSPCLPVRAFDSNVRNHPRNVCGRVASSFLFSSLLLQMLLPFFLLNNDTPVPCSLLSYRISSLPSRLRILPPLAHFLLSPRSRLCSTGFPLFLQVIIASP